MIVAQFKDDEGKQRQLTLDVKDRLEAIGVLAQWSTKRKVNPTQIKLKEAA